MGMAAKRVLKKERVNVVDVAEVVGKVVNPQIKAKLPVAAAKVEAEAAEDVDSEGKLPQHPMLQRRPGPSQRRALRQLRRRPKP